MATKFSYLFSSNFFFFVLFPLLSHVKISHSQGEKPQTFGFLNNLRGCHKGDSVKGLYELKRYLENFGYVSHHHPNHQTHTNDDVFDDLLESAIKTYQLNFGLEPTGILDSNTVSTMMMPRCGVADIINGTNFMQSDKETHHRVSSPLRIVSHYAFFPGNPKWPANRTNLTYAFLYNTRRDAVTAVVNALKRWSSVSKFRFSQANYFRADIRIGFYTGDHRDGSPFDGRGGILAHAAQPTSGVLHFDTDEHWVRGAVPGAIDLETVALHEIGHVLGLEHSSVREAIMFPSIPAGVTKGFADDDIQGIQALYK